MIRHVMFGFEAKLANGSTIKGHEYARVYIKSEHDINALLEIPKRKIGEMGLPLEHAKITFTFFTILS